MAKKQTDRSNVITGIFLICIGILFFLNTFGFLNWRTWQMIFRFWPVILIIWGLNILLKKTGIWWLVPLLIVSLFSFFVVVSFQNIDIDQINFLNRFFITSEKSEESPGDIIHNENAVKDVEKLIVEINYGAGKLFLSNLDDSTKLYETELEYDNYKPEIIYEKEDNTGKLNMNQKTDVNRKKLVNTNDWNLYLAEKLPLEVDIDTGAGKIDVDLSKLQVERFDVNSGVSDLAINFANYNTQSRINAGASNIKLYVPSESGLQIKLSSLLGNNNFNEAGLVNQGGGLFQSDNYKEANNRINLRISSSASNIKLVYR